MPPMIDLTGRIFGKLTVVGDSGRRSSNGHLSWRCRCNCEEGKTVDVASAHLISGHTRSCGCLRRELGRKKRIDLTGRRYGRLMVEGDSGRRTRGRMVLWRCRCKCGETVYVQTGNLKNGNTRSCGCRIIAVNMARNKEVSAEDFSLDLVCLAREVKQAERLKKDIKAKIAETAA